MVSGNNRRGSSCIGLHRNAATARRAANLSGARRFSLSTMGKSRMKFTRALAEPPILADPEPPRSAERAALAQAIQQRDQAERMRRVAHEAAESARGLALDASGAWRAAQSEAVQARESQVMDRAEVAAAIAREAAALVEVRGAKQAATVLEDQTEAPERELRAARARVDKCARAVVAVCAAPLLEQAETAKVRYVAALAALGVAETAVDPFPGAELAADLRGALARGQSDDLAALARRHPAGDLWRAYAAALLVDGDAIPPPG